MDNKDRIQHNANTGKYHIDGGMKGYNSFEKASNALENFQKRTKQTIDDAIELQKSLKGKH
jgi:hypothetical protein